MTAAILAAFTVALITVSFLFWTAIAFAVLS
jgi:hypothetical protein